MTSFTLYPQALSAGAFSAYGQVLGLEPSHPVQHTHRFINGGNALRFDVVPDLHLTAEGGVPTLAIFQAKARQFPLAIEEMERHVLGSQTFVPLGTQRFILVVAAANSPCKAGDLQAFVTNGQQGVVLAPGTWHHALLAVEGGDFVVIERKAASVDCEVTAVTLPVRLQFSP